MNHFDLNPVREASTQPKIEAEGLGSAVLLHNARWFTRVRWAVIAVFLLAGILSLLLQQPLQTLGIHSLTFLAVGLALPLIAANTLFSLAINRMPPNAERRVVVRNIWTQIIVDLLAVTVLVHFIGSTCTPIPYTYLLHITLACIFLSPRNSFHVTLLATALYFCCVTLELTGMITRHSILITAPHSQLDATIPWLAPAYALSTVFFWFLVWYLVSTFSKAVRDRDQRLDLANKKLLAADEEKNTIVMRTTHDLKAPFTGMEMQIHMLRHQYWDELSEPVQTIIEKILTRAATLRERIKDIMTLGSIRSDEAKHTSLKPVELDEILGAAVLDVSERANHRGITINRENTTASIHADARQLHILFANLVANAVFYSHDGGTVYIAVKQAPNEIKVHIKDEGIGIAPDALPHIFDEYYRTREAAEFNKMSTGLGLAIVGQIVANFEYTIHVESEQGKGTTFEVCMPLTRQ
ncbi:MAG: hypothetical protein ISS35_08045 [Kiritimatiellae bacterium]|nr:hypothetical protein [Kiritimatiellia bacterium]